MQVFDKALLEPGFSEIYATLCFDLNQSLPSFKDESGEEGAMEITFRRVLLNKCQEEFEEGDAAMKAVEAREKAEQEKADAKVRLWLLTWDSGFRDAKDREISMSRCQNYMNAFA